MKAKTSGSLDTEPSCNAWNARDAGLIPGSERSPGEGNGNPLQYSSLENPMDRGAWWATVQGVTRRRTQLKGLNHHHKDTKQQNAASFMPVKLSCVTDINTSMCVYLSRPSDRSSSQVLLSLALVLNQPLTPAAQRSPRCWFPSSLLNSSSKVSLQASAWSVRPDDPFGA